MLTESHIRHTIKKLHIPEEWREDAVQEGWVAHSNGESIITHLAKWLREEKKYRKNHIFFSELHKEQRKDLGII
jgi:hypothetical protein